MYLKLDNIYYLKVFNLMYLLDILEYLDKYIEYTLCSEFLWQMGFDLFEQIWFEQIWALSSPWQQYPPFPLYT